MDGNSVFSQDLFQQILEITQKLGMGDFSQVIQENAALEGELLEFAYVINTHLVNMRQLEGDLPRLKNSIAQLIASINDVLQTIEKATIRVLDNTDGILEQHDIIEKNLNQLIQNPAIYRVIGKRLDLIRQAQNKSRMFIFDVIQAQDFQEATKKQTQVLVGVLQDVQKDLGMLQELFRIKDQAAEGYSGLISAETQQALASQDGENPKQDAVDALLAEFGL